MTEHAASQRLTSQREFSENCERQAGPPQKVTYRQSGLPRSAYNDVSMIHCVVNADRYSEFIPIRLWSRLG